MTTVPATQHSARHSWRYCSLALLVAFTHACKPAGGAWVGRHAEPAGTASDAFEFVHGVRLYVSAVNCEMNAEDAARVNALAERQGLTVEVVFTGIAAADTSVAQRARDDLGLLVPVRIMRAGELVQYKSIGTAQLPVALVVKSRQLKTIVAGENMPRTLTLLEASFSPTVVP